MKPRGPLMKEHRVIEKMIALVQDEIRSIGETGEVHVPFINAAVDFIRVYADRTHHGKEEDILFKALENRDMDETHAKQMQDLVEEHKYGRRLVKSLVNARDDYREGDQKAAGRIQETLQALVDFYPGHIKKEDDDFFPATEPLFSEKEQEQMLDDFWEFDREMIHEKYRRVVDQWEMKHGS